MNLGVGGLSFFGLVIGQLLVGLYILLIQGRYNKKLIANNNVPIPEWRLPPVMVGAVCLLLPVACSGESLQFYVINDTRADGLDWIRHPLHLLAMLQLHHRFVSHVGKCTLLAPKSLAPNANRLTIAPHPARRSQFAPPITCRRWLSSLCCADLRQPRH